MFQDLLCKVFYKKIKKVDLSRVLVLKDNTQKYNDILWDCLHFEYFEYPNSINLRL